MPLSVSQFSMTRRERERERERENEKRDKERKREREKERERERLFIASCKKCARHKKWQCCQPIVMTFGKTIVFTLRL
jgi:hypothetical protein